MKRSAPAPSPLAQAATELNPALGHFAALTETPQEAPLNSQKKLQQAAHLFQQLGEEEEILQGLVQRTVAALLEARQAQENAARGVQAKAEAFQERSETLRQILLGYGALGEEACALRGA